jgi:hypothetical protein
MLKRIHVAAVLVSMSILQLASVATAQLCPGQDGKLAPTNLACEFFVATRATTTYNQTAVAVGETIASQLGQLPLASAISGSGLTLNKSLGVFTATEDSLGAILNQRGETLGKNKRLISFTYQHFGFGAVDGIRLKNFPITQLYASSSSAAGDTYITGSSAIDLAIDQYTILLAYGLTKRVDVAVIIPLSKVTLSTRSNYSYFQAGSYLSPSTYNFPGSASGLGDVAVNLKANVYGGERFKIAVGSEFRFKTGDEGNYLGTGAYGVKPYVVFSRRGRLTPNLNIGYQWNGDSILSNNQNLPHSLLYSAGVDYRLTHKFTLVGEFVGRQVRNAPRLARTTQPVIYTSPETGTTLLPSVSTYNDSYCMDNIGGGFKANPFKNFYVNASVLVKLDDAGLRSKIIPLAGASYRF